ncbi:RIP metalloprotease RseP [Streptococcus hillyeri]|uniref:Zinc metalloprotease n=1 Tax=Streptococcus hillyeri TaxID=2282420 RepID=A0A3L9DL58_9STRE|nr:RIP metalloprotease RseP [Streptococcus hillyeri]RLY01494.1 RIP metalloprotease RseP [Streptococcus hillyeri]
MLGILSFIAIFGIIVTVHEFGHFYFAKKSCILVREFAIGMGPKIFAHIGKDGTAYTIRMLPLGGYVRMAGWGDDTTEIKTGTPAAITISADGIVTRINLSGKQVDKTALPINITSYDLENELSLSGLVLDEQKTYKVHHDATIIEEDGTEIRIAPLDVQYQNATIPGRMLTNFAGPMNNFILGIIIFIVLVFMQGGVENLDSTQIRATENGAFAKAGGQTGDRILSISGVAVSNWSELQKAVGSTTSPSTLDVEVEKFSGEKKVLSVTPVENSGAFYIGVMPSLKTSFLDKIQGGFIKAWQTTFHILNALKGLITNFSLDKLGGPVAMYQMSNQAAASGIESVLYLMAMISINLGIFNLIPIPALDGGKIVINILEAIRRKPLKQETETYVTLAGVAIMVVLMIAVTWNDIMRVFF